MPVQPTTFSSYYLYAISMWVWVSIESLTIIGFPNRLQDAKREIYYIYTFDKALLKSIEAVNRFVLLIYYFSCLTDVKISLIRKYFFLYEEKKLTLKKNSSRDVINFEDGDEDK